MVAQMVASACSAGDPGVNVPDFSFIVILGVCALVYLLIFYDIKKCITMFEQQLTKKV